MEALELKLIQQNLVNSDQLSLARQDAERSGKSVWAELVKLGFLSEEDIAVFFAQESGINYVKVLDYEIDYEIVRLFDENLCRLNSVIPLFKLKDTLFIASVNPLDASLADNLSKIAGCPVELLCSSRRSINQALDLYWGPENKTFEYSQFLYKQGPLQGLTAWRESERLDLSIPVGITIEDKTISLNTSMPLDGYTRNISQSGTAVGLQVFLFLPKGTTVSLEFKPYAAGAPASIRAKGEIVYSRMEKGRRYLLGIVFTRIDDTNRSQLLKLTSQT